MRHGTKTTKLTFGALAMAAATVFAIGSTSSDARADDCKASATKLCGDHYSIDIQTGSCSAGSECAVTLTLTAIGDGYHVNKDFNHKFTADGGGVTFLGKDGKVFSKNGGDMALNGDGHSAKLTVRFKPAAKGNVSISGSYRLAVCTDNACSPTTQAVPAISVAVK